MEPKKKVELTAIQLFMKKHKLTGYAISKVGGFPSSRIEIAKKKTVDQLSVTVLRAIAETASMSAGEALDEMLEIEENMK